MVMTYSLLSIRCIGILTEELCERDVDMRTGSRGPVEISRLDDIHYGKGGGYDGDQ